MPNPKVEVDRTEGYAPRRVDKRGVLEMLRDEINERLGNAPGQKKDVRVGTEGKGLMEAVDEAVTGAPAPGPSNDY